MDSDDGEEDDTPGWSNYWTVTLPVLISSLDPAPRSPPPAKLKSKLKDVTLEGSRILYDLAPANGQTESKPKSKRRRVVESESEGDEPPGTDFW